MALEVVVVAGSGKGKESVVGDCGSEVICVSGESRGEEYSSGSLKDLTKMVQSMFL